MRRPAVSNLGRDRRLTLNHCERGISPGVGAAEPAGAKDPEIGQRSILRRLPVGQVINEARSIEPVRGRQCLGAYRAVHLLSSKAERLLQ